MQRPGRSPKLTEEQRKLQKMQDELHRQQQEIEQRLLKLPAQIEEKKRKETELKKLRTQTAAPAISLSGARGMRPSGTDRKRRRLPSQELQYARVKFFVGCLLLLALFLLLWKQIPS